MTMRKSALNDRHRALGSKLDGDTFCNMPVPWTYKTDPHDEVVAVRSRAGLYDVSALNLVHVAGSDAAAILDRLVAIDVPALKPGTARLAAEVDESGALIDDVMIICDAPNKYRVSHGSGATPNQLKKVADGRNVSIESDSDVHVLSLQGPTALRTLMPHTPMQLNKLPYFHHNTTTLFGKNVTLSRGGYSGEHGYEIYCASADVGFIWDSILEHGRAHGIIPASWNSLDLIRVEASLLFFPFDMPEGDTTPWEVNMHWAVDLNKKGDYIGKQALLHLHGRERFRQAGIVCRSENAVEPGSRIHKDGNDIGVVTSSSYSRYLMQSLAMVHLLPAHTALGTQVIVRGKSVTCTGTVVATPFYDPLRLRTR